MNDLFDVVIDAVCDFLGLEKRRGHEPGIFRWVLRVLWKIFLLLFGLLALILSVFRIRRRPRKRRRWLLWVILWVAILAGAFLAWYFLR